ncbi:RIO1 family-domain-containing protein [Cyathus striatus]|nr:RIO1 family-domain-containing protein [Cyathus striatus]
MASIAAAAPLDDGQFDDAPDAPTQQIQNRDGQFYIDTYDPVNEHDEDEGYDELDEDYDDNRVEDEDWEVAERGTFYKTIQPSQATCRCANGKCTRLCLSINGKTTVASLPAVNHPKTTAAVTPATADIHPKGKDRTIDQLAALAKFNSRIAKIDVPYQMGVGVNRKGPSAHANTKDKSDRATSEQVLDPRTRLILFKMIGRGLIHEVNGCVSTGKEANVYHALTPESTHLALKIYKTSILVFKDRDKYVTGEYRFRRGYSRNPRKMVRLWAEKEMRNLKRLVAAGIRCPDPIEVRENVLVMTFVGDNEGWASPRLKDAELDSASLASLYAELVLTVWTMFHQCKLVHADLSEYNILYHEGHLWIIDVSQSVEHDHPAAFDFLRNDIKNIEEFFGRLGVNVLGLRRCFEFVTQENIGEGSEPDALQKWIDEAPVDGSADGESGNNGDAAHEDSVFMRSFIPRTLNEVYDPERDAERVARGEGEGLIYKNTIGVVGLSTAEKHDNSGNSEGNKVKFIDDSDKDTLKEIGEPSVQLDNGDSQDEVSDEGSENDDEDSESEEGDAKEGGVFMERKPRGHRHEDKEVKKERKKAAKEQAREKRKHKMPKAEKKKIIKKSARGS